MYGPGFGLELDLRLALGLWFGLRFRRLVNGLGLALRLSSGRRLKVMV